MYVSADYFIQGRRNGVGKAQGFFLSGQLWNFGQLKQLDDKNFLKLNI